MQPSRNVRWAYGVRISTLPYFTCHMTSMEIDSLFQMDFCRLADSEKRIYKYANKLNTKGAYLWKKQLQYLQLKKQENY